MANSGADVPLNCETVSGMRTGFLQALGGEAGCTRLSADFYARVGKDSVLRPLFPGKSLRCATEEFAAFLIQFRAAMRTKPNPGGG